MKDNNVYCDYCNKTVIATKKKSDVEGFDYLLTPTKDFHDTRCCKECWNEYREKNRS